MNRTRIDLLRVFRRTAVPLASYYAVTLALPLANGAAQSGGAFVNHALVVLVVPPLVVMFAFAMCTLARASCAYVVSGFSRTGRIRT